MNRIQAGEGSAIDATRPITDAASPEDDWIIEILQTCSRRQVQRNRCRKDLGGEADVREILGWLNTEGWIVLENIGEVEHEWNVSRDRVSFAAPSSEARRPTWT